MQGPLRVEPGVHPLADLLVDQGDAVFPPCSLAWYIPASASAQQRLRGLVALTQARRR